MAIAYTTAIKLALVVPAFTTNEYLVLQAAMVYATMIENQANKLPPS